MENNTQTQKDIFDLNEQEFEQYFQAEIAPQIQRKNYPKIYKMLKVDLIAGCVFFLFWVIYSSYQFLRDKKSSGFSTLDITAGIIAFCVLFFMSIILLKGVLFNPKENIKKVITKDVLTMFGFLYTITKGSDQSEPDVVSFKKILKETFFSSSKIKLDDIIDGKYKDMFFTLADVLDKSDKKASHKIIFATDIKKDFKGDVSIFKKNNSLIKQFSSNNKVVNLEDVSFSKEYQVSADDQIEARYLLTPAFMERLLRYKKARNCDVEVLFSKKHQEFGTLFFCIYGSKNMFELPDGDVESIAKNPKYFYNIISEIKEIMLIVDALKLDQDIGM